MHEAQRFEVAQHAEHNRRQREALRLRLIACHRYDAELTWKDLGRRFHVDEATAKRWCLESKA